MTNKKFTKQERIKLFGEEPHGAIKIPDEYTSIGDGAFYECSSLTSVTIPDSVTSIGYSAFYECSSLTSVTIPDSVTSIGDYAFRRCENLTSVTIPNSVTSIGGWAFKSCESLTSVTIPNSVTSIEGWAFSDCSNLTSITIPDTVISIWNYAFCGCHHLKSKKANYKAFNINNKKLFCMDYVYAPNKWSDKIDNIELCKSGYHFCTNLFEIFDYYSGELDKDIAIYECEIGDMFLQEEGNSKCVTNTIKPVKRLYKNDVIRILNGEKE